MYDERQRHQKEKNSSLHKIHSKTARGWWSFGIRLEQSALCRNEAVYAKFWSLCDMWYRYEKARQIDWGCSEKYLFILSKATSSFKVTNQPLILLNSCRSSSNTFLDLELSDFFLDLKKKQKTSAYVMSQFYLWHSF